MKWKWTMGINRFRTFQTRSISSFKLAPFHRSNSKASLERAAEELDSVVMEQLLEQVRSGCRHPFAVVYVF